MISEIVTWPNRFCCVLDTKHSAREPHKYSVYYTSRYLFICYLFLQRLRPNAFNNNTHCTTEPESVVDAQTHTAYNKCIHLIFIFIFFSSCCVFLFCKRSPLHALPERHTPKEWEWFKRRIQANRTKKNQHQVFANA